MVVSLHIVRSHFTNTPCTTIEMMPMIKKSKLREKEMIADILPLERAVKRAEVNILLPLSKKLSENN